MSTNGNCPTNTGVAPRSFNGKMDAEFFRNGVVSHTFSSTDVIGDQDFFNSNSRSERIEIRFTPPLVDGKNTYNFSAQDTGFLYAANGKIYFVSGDVQVESTNSGDDVALKVSGTFFDGARMIVIEGQGELHYEFP